MSVTGQMPLCVERDDDLLSIRRHPYSFLFFCFATLLAPYNLILARFWKQYCDGLDCNRELGYWESWQSFVPGSARGLGALHLCSVCRRNGVHIPSTAEMEAILRQRRRLKRKRS